MADVDVENKHDYSTDICLLQTSVNLNLDETIVAVVIGLSIREMNNYADKTGFDPNTASEVEAKKTLEKVVDTVTRLINEKIDGTFDRKDVLTIMAEFSNVVDEFKRREGIKE